ncbi:hypothetical protein DAPPUDRAFT_261695 [Daphnia pulex]|uniref:Uncharacterized protein n=1 Tax=Daphnia pulex TaxID=6669 RepID=E9HLG9_DAPPU|nr:hypothetical protein DAPPUDRAFT_261695 [Daphnia pulex]|eukprot:EFX67344.1 hypothetical protein DAPPUDRAFT_261695 [Daphnia pulex]
MRPPTGWVEAELDDIQQWCLQLKLDWTQHSVLVTPCDEAGRNLGTNPGMQLSVSFFVCWWSKKNMIKGEYGENHNQSHFTRPAIGEELLVQQERLERLNVLNVA